MLISLMSVAVLTLLMIITGNSVARSDTIVIEVNNVIDVSNYYKKIGYIDLIDNPIRLQSVPRTRLLRVPRTLKKSWIENVKLRKSVFFRLGLSGILQANEKILKDRMRLSKLSLDSLSNDDRIWLLETMQRYRVSSNDSFPTTDQLSEMLLKIDILPPSLVLAQGAIESGWLQSRFAREGQAIFGQWTTSEKGIKALDSEVRLAAFESPYESLNSYMLNLNTHPAYENLRTKRAVLRRQSKVIDGYSLAGYMNVYAETGEEYVKLIRDLIRRDSLSLTDTAKLADGSLTIFKNKDH